MLQYKGKYYYYCYYYLIFFTWDPSMWWVNRLCGYDERGGIDSVQIFEIF